MQCITIARHMVNYKDFIRAKEWLMVGLKMYEADEEIEYIYSQLGMPLVDFYELFVEIQDKLGRILSIMYIVFAVLIKFYRFSILGHEWTATRY